MSKLPNHRSLYADFIEQVLLPQGYVVPPYGALPQSTPPDIVLHSPPQNEGSVLRFFCYGKRGAVSRILEVECNGSAVPHKNSNVVVYSPSSSLGRRGGARHFVAKDNPTTVQRILGARKTDEHYAPQQTGRPVTLAL